MPTAAWATTLDFRMMLDRYLGFSMTRVRFSRVAGRRLAPEKEEKDEKQKVAEEKMGPQPGDWPGNQGLQPPWTVGLPPQKLWEAFEQEWERWDRENGGEGY